MAPRHALDLAVPAFPWRLGPALLAHHCEAATVMFDHWHTPPITAKLRHGSSETNLSISWHPPSPTQQAAHANLHEATEHGAYAVAFAAVYAAARYVVVRRAHHRSGADFLVVREGEPEQAFVKLEVSGIASPTTSSLAARLRGKSRQVRGGSLPAPGIAAVVCFRDPIVALVEVP